MRTFRDADDLPSSSMAVNPPRVIQFLDVLWRAQAINTAKDNSLQVRTIIDPANEYRGQCTLFWTVYSPSQYDRILRKENVLMYIGDTDDGLEAQEGFQLKKAICIYLHEDTPTYVFANELLAGGQ